VQPSLAHHQQLFGRAPWLLAADRGCWSPENEAAAQAAGVEQDLLTQTWQQGRRPPETWSSRVVPTGLSLAGGDRRAHPRAEGAPQAQSLPVSQDGGQGKYHAEQERGFTCPTRVSHQNL